MNHSLAAMYKPKFDAAESAFVERALLWVEEQTYDTLIPPLEGRKYVPTDNKSSPGAKFTSYRQYTRTGLARLITERGADLPNVGFYVKEFFHQFYEMGAAYEYSYFDLLAAARAAENGGPPVNLDLELSIAAKEAIEKKLDLIAAVGSQSSAFDLDSSVDVGMLGLLNQPNATIYNIATGVSGETQWSDKTPDEVLADLTGIVAAQIAGTYKIETPDTILLPVTQLEDIAGRSMGDGRSDTILSYFLRTNKHIKEVDSWIYLAGAGTDSEDRMVAYKKDPRKVRHMISLEFTQLDPQRKDLVYHTPCVAKSAGVVCPYPLGVSYGDGI